MNTLFKLLLGTIVLLLLSGCRDFLEEKSSSKLTTIESLADLQALLDNYGFLNTEFASEGEMSSDDFYLTDSHYNSLPFEENKRLYLWMPDNVAKPASLGNNWMSCYRAIYICNSVLHELDSQHFNGRDQNYIRGQALALRASRYLDAVQVWCLAYDPATANQTLGLPLRLDPDMNVTSVRSTLQETYDQILADLSHAVELLPNPSGSRMRITKDAVYGLLSRAYLYMGDYNNALTNAEKALNITSTLMNFSELNPDEVNPISELNSEVLFFGMMDYEDYLVPARINNSLYLNYDENDLRKQIFFNVNNDGEVFFKGYYNNFIGPNPAPAVDELYLIAAECKARLNQHIAAMQQLNDLLITRWKPGTFVPFVAQSKEEALQIISRERRKELLIRGLRWADLKRYNRDGAQISISRTINGHTFVLPPNDLRYAIALPDEIIKLSGMVQNPR